MKNNNKRLKKCYSGLDLFLDFIGEVGQEAEHRLKYLSNPKKDFTRRWKLSFSCVTDFEFNKKAYLQSW
jgi:hypothetical protein